MNTLTATVIIDIFVLGHWSFLIFAVPSQ